MFDSYHLADLMRLPTSLSKDNVGDAMIRAVALKSIIADPRGKIKADEILETIRNFARSADIGWKVFEDLIVPTTPLSEMQTWQLLAIVGILMELNYCFERVEEASFFTFENSAPVRFYVNGIFHYLASMFLLDAKDNFKKGFHYPGTLIKALQPMGLEELLKPIYQIFDRPFGGEMSYDQTVLSVRNKGFVHSSFSPENIKKTVKDTHIFDEKQKMLFIQNHWDLFDHLIILRLRLISILTSLNLNFDTFSPSRLYHF